MSSIPTHRHLRSTRRNVTTRSALASLLLCSSSLVAADGLDAVPDVAAPLPPPTPITIEADQFEVLYSEDKAIWTGDVSATQGNYTFRTSVLTIRLDQIGDPGAENAETENNSPTKTRPPVNLTAKQLSYDLEQALIIGSGDSELRRGEEIIRADQITYNVQARTAHAVPGDNGRVYVRFFSNPNKPVLPGTALFPAGGQ